MLSSLSYLTKILLPNIPEDDGGICLMEVYGVFFRNEDFFFSFQIGVQKEGFWVFFCSFK